MIITSNRIISRLRPQPCMAAVNKMHLSPPHLPYHDGVESAPDGLHLLKALLVNACCRALFFIDQHLNLVAKLKAYIHLSVFKKPLRHRDPSAGTLFSIAHYFVSLYAAPGLAPEPLKKLLFPVPKEGATHFGSRCIIYK